MNCQKKHKKQNPYYDKFRTLNSQIMEWLKLHDYEEFLDAKLGRAAKRRGFF